MSYDSIGEHHAMLELLNRMKAEAERHARAIEALDHERAARAQQLLDLQSDNQRSAAEVAEIEAKSLTSAGNARAHAEVLAAEQRCVAQPL